MSTQSAKQKAQMIEPAPAPVMDYAVRDGFGEGLVRAATDDPNVVALCADLAESTRNEEFARRFPDRYIETGVAEQNLAGIASGLGVSGKIPFLSSYAVFSPGRNWEQIRTTIAYNNANVKIAGHHAGVSVGTDGATHQALEDIALMRALPNMKVIVPCDAREAAKATIAAAKIWGPVYLRLAREKSPLLTELQAEFVPGKADVLLPAAKPQVVIFGCGPVLAEALAAARELAAEKISAAVVNVHTVKPLDHKTIVEFARKAGAAVTVEDHTVLGGLGGAIAELLARTCPVPMEFVGTEDVFGASGRPAELAVRYGLTAKHIKAAAKKAYRRK